MYLLGVTGGIGMGKSATADLLRVAGVAVVDTDELARRVVQPGEPALAEIQARFGAAMLGPDGQLRRSDLARRVFANAEELKALEAILHPRIRALWRDRVKAWRVAGQKIGAVIIPLLYETGAETEFDAIICVACSAATQQQRLAARGWSREQIQHRIAAQWPVEKKLAQSDFVVWTEGGFKVLEAQLRLILAASERFI